jgi:hypothetical protein
VVLANSGNLHIATIGLKVRTDSIQGRFDSLYQLIIGNGDTHLAQIGEFVLQK